jgi:hypothetical protein
MAQAFDPYYKWLGIPPQEQPPNHYRLLALRAFEDDPDVIESAADQRMAHLRTFQGGQYAALSQKLLNEVATAKVCLLNAQKRARYDQELKAQELKAQQSKAGDSAVAAPPAPPVTSGFDLSMIGVGGASGSSVSAVRKKTSSTKVPSGISMPPGPPPVPGTDVVPATNKHMPLIIVGASCLGLLLLIGIVLSFRKGGQASDDPSNVNNVATDDATAKPKPTAAAIVHSDDNLLSALAAFNAAHPPGSSESPLAKGPLGRGLILHMSFEPATIEQRDGRLFVRDLSGNGHHGASASAQLWGQGKVGAGLLCQSPLLISTALIDRQSQFTLVAWVSHPASMSDGAWYSEAGANPIFSLSTGKEVTLRSRGMRSGVMSRMRVPDAVAPPETWNFFALRGSHTPDGQGRLIIQVNDAVSQIQNDSCVPASIGGNSRQSSICSAAGLRIDELMVFDRMLSEAELRILRTRTDPGDGGPIPGPAVVESPKPTLASDTFKPGLSEPDRPLLLEPAAGATLPNGAKSAGVPAEWIFRWMAVPHAQGYEVSVDSPAPEKLKIDSNVVGTSLRMLAHGVAATENCRGWRWKVRAKLDDRWSEWSSERPFNLESPHDEVAGQADTKDDATDATKPDAAAAAIKRQALPDLAAQRKAQELVNDVYAKSIAAARNREMLLTIAQDMVRKAADNPADAAEEYALLDRARLLAAEAGGAAAALEIIDQLDKHFEIKPLAMKVETLTICLKKTGLGPDAATEVASATLDLMQELARSDNIDAALALGQLMRDHIRKPSDPAVLRKLPAVTRWLHELQAESAKVNSARQKLADNPADADANTAVGRFECFVRHDWQSGLQHLAKGSDAALREIAQAELAVPRLLADREKLADLWYERAEKETTPANKQAMFFRARYWYEGVLGELSGLQRAKVDKRITRIGQLLGE